MKKLTSENSTLIVQLINEYVNYIDKMEKLMEDDDIDEYPLSEIDFDYNNGKYNISYYNSSNENNCFIIIHDRVSTNIVHIDSEYIIISDDITIKNYSNYKTEEDIFQLSTIENIGTFTAEQFQSIKKSLDYIISIIHD